MKLRIFTKLFLVMLLSLFIPLGTMMVSVHWSFRQGFEDYLHRVELERLEKLIGLLGQSYRAHGGWDFLKDNPHAWMDLLRQGLGQGSGMRERPPPGETTGIPWRPTVGTAGRGATPPEPLPEVFGSRPSPPGELLGFRGHRPPPPPDPLLLGLRLRLFDVERQPVVRPPPPFLENKASVQPPSLLPILVNEVPVGWLGVQRSNIVSDRLALAFVEQQFRTDAMILLLALAAAVLASWILARQIIQPLRRIAAGTKELVSGHYDVSIPVGGDELGDLARDFNLLARTLKRNEEARQHWIADISHELRTPLAILQGEIEALQDGLRTPSPETIESLHAEVLSLGKLVDDLYQLSLSDLGALDYRRDSMDVGEALSDAVESFRPRFEGKDIELTCRIEGPAHIHGDRRRLSQLFSNLLENSYRHTNAGGRCAICLEISADAVVVTVEDSAPGVPAEALDKLFDRLFRVDSSRSREHGGAGLGLAICKNIVEAHAGRILARASSLGGLGLRIELPRQLT